MIRPLVPRSRSPPSSLGRHSSTSAPRDLLHGERQVAEEAGGFEQTDFAQLSSEPAAPLRFEEMLESRGAQPESASDFSDGQAPAVFPPHQPERDTNSPVRCHRGSLRNRSRREPLLPKAESTVKTHIVLRRQKKCQCLEL